MDTGPIVELKNLYKTFRAKTGAVEALKDVSITVETGDIFGIIGVSGAGKARWYEPSTCWKDRTAAVCEYRERTSPPCRKRN